MRALPPWAPAPEEAEEEPEKFEWWFDEDGEVDWQHGPNYSEEEEYTKFRVWLAWREKEDWRVGKEIPWLKDSQQLHLQTWNPASSGDSTQQQEQGAAAATTEAAEAATEAAEPQAAAGAAATGPATYDELLAELPGLPRLVRETVQDRTGLMQAPTPDAWTADVPFRYARKQDPELTPWDLRAKMEKRRRQERDRAVWDEQRAAVGRFPTLGTDWRSDVRLQETGDPTDPVYREWTHKEIWDLITLNGQNADPREVELFVRDPVEIADGPSQGGSYHMEAEEYFESMGALIKEEDLMAIKGSAAGVGAEAEGAEAALLAAEFTDFDEELTGDYDAEYGAAAATGGSDEEF